MPDATSHKSAIQFKRMNAGNPENRIYVILFQQSNNRLTAGFGVTHQRQPFEELHPLFAAVHRSNASAANFNQSKRLHDRDELLDLGNTTCNFESEMLG